MKACGQNVSVSVVHYASSHDREEDMKKVSECPNCHSHTKGVDVKECAKCRKRFCSRCQKGRGCPDCKTGYRTVAKIG
jgi:transposase